MKIKIWDILTVLILAGCILMVVVFLSIYSDPTSAMNPFPPFQIPPTVDIPTSTATLRQFPSTWTQTPEGTVVLIPSSTSLPTSTGFILPTATRTPTSTRTRTNTPTKTRTPTVTNTPNFTATALSLFATHQAQTAQAAAATATESCLQTQTAGGTCP
jgi:cytoskeletal protein RodZ